MGVPHFNKRPENVYIFTYTKLFTIVVARSSFDPGPRVLFLVLCGCYDLPMAPAICNVHGVGGAPVRQVGV